MDTLPITAPDDALRLPVRETFAGPGGWSQALRAMGLDGDAIGYEKDPDACATAEAAGFKRIQADVSMVDLRDLEHLAGEFLFIGSPPCQSFSSAGRQKGKLDRPRLDAHVARVRAAGRWSHYSREGWHDPRSPLVLEPLRWILTLRPRYVALEQVPPVLPLWEQYAEIMREHGYHVAVGVLTAEQFGVPQTRKRAFLAARLCPVPSGYQRLRCECVEMRLPAPTHRAYRKGVPQSEGDPGLLPWVSMSDALGWASGGFPRRPSACGCSRHSLGETVEIDGVTYQARDMRCTDEPAKTLTEKARSWQLRQSAMVNATVRLEGQPAPTITSGHDRAERVWEPAEMHSSGVAASEREGRSRVAPRPVDEPAPTIHRRRLGDDVADERYGDRAGTKAVRVSVAEAGVLQSCPVDYPWQGSRTAQYRQVGDMVPPLLALAVLRAVVGQ